MSRYFRRVHPYHLAFLTGLKPSYDIVMTPAGIEKEKDEEVTGWEGIQALFKKDKKGDIHAALVNLLNASVFCAMCGGLYGSAIGSQMAFHEFIENNDATKFPSQHEAKRQLRDKVTVSMGRHGLKWAVRVGSFSTIFMSTVTLMTAYLGGNGIVEYVLGGSLTGALYKVNMGLRGMLAGCIVGTTFGTALGVAFNFMFWLSGTDLRELSEVQKEFKALRKTMSLQSIRKNTANEYGELHKESEENDLSKLSIEPTN